MSLRTKILLPLLLLSTLLLVYLYGYWMPRSLGNIDDEHRVSVERHVESVAEGLVPLLLAHQLDIIYENLDALGKRNADWISIQLVDADGRTIYPLQASPPAFQGRSGQDVHIIERQIGYLDMHLGKLIVRVDFAPKLLVTKKRHWELMIAVLIIIAGYVVTTGFVLDRAAGRPVNLLARAAKKLAEGDFDVTLPKKGNDEVGILVDSFRRMTDAIRTYQGRLREQREFLKKTIESLTHPFYVINAADYVVIMANAAAGLDLSAGGNTCYALTHRLDRPCHGSDHLCPLEIVRQTKEPVTVEHTHYNKEGDARIVEVHGYPVLDDGGNVVQLIEYALDITERKRAEEAVTAASAYNRSLIESSLDPLVTIDTGGKITDVNAATEKVTGSSREELIGADFSDYFTEPERARAVYQQVFREGTVRDYALEIRHRDGHETPVLYNASAYRNQAGDVIGVFAIARDITERARMEEDLRKLNEELERRVRERTAELEEKNEELHKMNRLFVGRELRMIELKERMRDLESRPKREE